MLQNIHHTVWFGTKHKENSVMLNTLFSKGIIDEENIPNDVIIQDNGNFYSNYECYF